MKHILIMILISTIVIMICQVVHTKNMKNKHRKPVKRSRQRCIPSTTWKGVREGYVFKTEDGVTGYYLLSGEGANPHLRTPNR